MNKFLIIIPAVIIGLIALGLKFGVIKVQRSCPYSRSAQFRELQRKLSQEDNTSDGDWL